VCLSLPRRAERVTKGHKGPTGAQVEMASSLSGSGIGICKEKLQATPSIKPRFHHSIPPTVELEWNLNKIIQFPARVHWNVGIGNVAKFLIPIPIPRIWNLELYPLESLNSHHAREHWNVGIGNVAKFPIPIPIPRIWNLELSPYKHLNSHYARVHWNVGIGNVAKFPIPIPIPRIWNLELSP